MVLARRGVHAHASAFGCELDGVGKQDVEQLSDPLGIAGDEHPFAKVALERDALRLGQAGERRYGRLHERGHVEGAPLERQDARLGTVEEDEVIDEAQQPLGVARDHVEELHLFGRVVSPDAVAEQFGEAEDRGEGRPELMGDLGQEGRFHSVQFHEALVLVPLGGEQLRPLGLVARLGGDVSEEPEVAAILVVDEDRYVVALEHPPILHGDAVSDHAAAFPQDAGHAVGAWHPRRVTETPRQLRAERCQRPANELVGRARDFEEVDKGLIREDDGAIGVFHEGGDVERSDERAQTFVRLKQAGSGFTALGHVLGADDDALHDGILDEVLARALEVAPLALVAEDSDLEGLARGQLTGLDATEHLEGDRDVVAVQQAEHARGGVEVRQVTQQTGSGGIGVTPGAIGVEDRDDVGCTVEKGHDESLARAQLDLSCGGLVRRPRPSASASVGSSPGSSLGSPSRSSAGP